MFYVPQYDSFEIVKMVLIIASGMGVTLLLG